MDGSNYCIAAPYVLLLLYCCTLCLLLLYCCTLRITIIVLLHPMFYYYCIAPPYVLLWYFNMFCENVDNNGWSLEYFLSEFEYGNKVVLLAVSESVRQPCVEEGLVQPLMSLLTSHNIAVTTQACRALGNICFDCGKCLSTCQIYAHTTCISNIIQLILVGLIFTTINMIRNVYLPQICNQIIVEKV